MQYDAWGLMSVQRITVRLIILEFLIEMYKKGDYRQVFEPKILAKKAETQPEPDLPRVFK